MNTFILNRKSFLTLTGIALSSFIWGQAYVVDAGRFSNLSMTGTARIQALGGAQYALGGDLSTLAGNPAGLGVYRKSEFGISSALQFGNFQTTYTTPSDVTQTSANRNNFHIPNFAFIVTEPVSETSVSAWKGGTWGIGFTRTNDFQSRTKFRGNNDANNLRSSLIEDSFGVDTSAYNFNNLGYYDVYQSGNSFNGILEGNNAISDLMGQAYWSDLLYYENGLYKTFDAGKPVFQDGEILTKGSQSQWDIGYGNNYMDRLYLGGTVSGAILRYSEETTYTETSTDPTALINNYTHYQLLEQRGAGIFMKLGLIYRVTDYIRVASAFQTPTWYFMNEDFETKLYTQWNGFSPLIGYSSYDYAARVAEFQYAMRTPMRWTNAISAFFGKRGFITADFEYVPYKQTKFSSFDYNFNDENAAIKARYKNVWNIRVGSELRFDKVFLRGGYAYYADPVNSSDNVDRSKTYLTGGIGVRWGNQHLDFSLINELSTSSYRHYELSDASEPVAVSKGEKIKGVITWGVYLD